MPISSTLSPKQASAILKELADTALPLNVSNVCMLIFHLNYLYISGRCAPTRARAAESRLRKVHVRLSSRARDVHDRETHRAEDLLAELAVAHSIASLALFAHQVRGRPFGYLLGSAMIARGRYRGAVSYTHLTLPTIYSV